MNGKANIHFTDGSKLKNDEEAKYLGGVITRRLLTRKELEARISVAFVTAKKLKLCFKRTRCSDSWKLQVYNAVLISKLLYGLETIELLDSH